jgi:hypothetical protein
MSSLPILPMNIVNRIMRDADILAKKKNIRRFIYNKVSGNHEFRCQFRQWFLKKFIKVENCLRFKLQNPPQVTLILPTTIDTPFKELVRFRNSDQTPEEREAIVSRMRPVTIVKFPQKTHHYKDGGEMEYRYSYCSFDDGHVFIEKNTLDDDDDFYLLFWRGYICLDGRTFPIFNMPNSDYNYLETPDQNPHGINNCTEIKFLEKELGQKVRIPNYSQTNYSVYDEDKKDWCWTNDCVFTEKEARFLVPHFEEPDYYDDYYSD